MKLEHLDGWSNARNFHIWRFSIWTMKANVQTSGFWMHDLPYEWPRPNGNTHRPDGAAAFPYLCFGKKSHSWSNTGWHPDMLLRRPNGCKLEQFEASWQRGRSGRKVLIVRTDDAWTVERLDDITCHPNGCKGTKLIALNSAQSLLWSSKLKCRLRIKQHPCIISTIT
jgi:hypothetical protein